MNDNRKEKKTDDFLNIFLLISIILLGISIAFPFIVNYFFSNWKISGTFGDTFGALSGFFSALATAGVIITILIQKQELKNQRLELQLQRTEMKESRSEFLRNRITNLVYNQLDRFDKSLNELVIKHKDQTYTGNDAISLLNSFKFLETLSSDTSEDEIIKLRKEEIINLLKVYIPNRSQIEKFAHNAFNTVEVLKHLIYTTDLEIHELNEMKNIFFGNIGFVSMGVLKQLSYVLDRKSEYLQLSDYTDNKIDSANMFRITIFLNPIIDFFNLKLTKDNFSQLKSEWIKSAKIELNY